MIEIKNVSKKYGQKEALKDVSFTVEDGEIFAFIGHNGAGKTTLIKAIVGIHEFDQGEILINNKSIIDDAIECKKEMAFVPDNPELYENMIPVYYQEGIWKIANQNNGIDNSWYKLVVK